MTNLLGCGNGLIARFGKLKKTRLGVTHTHIREEAFWCLGSNLEMTNLLGCGNGLIAGFGKLKKTRLGVTLLEQEAWRA